jgi:hypothetical protein
VYQAGNRHIESELMFRVSLRIDLKAFEKYVNLKKEAASKYRYDPPAYTDEKSARVMEWKRRNPILLNTLACKAWLSYIGFTLSRIRACEIRDCL